MAMKDDGGPAYPSHQNVCVPGSDVPGLAVMGGMSLHDYYVGQLLTNPVIVDTQQVSAWVIESANAIADAMIAEKRRREAEEAESDD